MLSSLQRGAHDPAHRIAADGTRLARQSDDDRPGDLPDHPARAGRAVRAQAWGPGAAELLGRPTPAAGGRRRTRRPSTPSHPVLVRAVRELPGYRVPRTGRVVEALVPAVLEQRVIGLDAFDAWRRLVTWHGDPAPGPAPAGMRVPPDAARWREIPTWDWHRAGVDPGRQRAVRSALTLADGLERAAERGDRAAVYRALLDVPGIGRWTAAEVGSRALGDADALPIGDYHLPALAGIALGDGQKLPEARGRGILRTVAAAPVPGGPAARTRPVRPHSPARAPAHPPGPPRSLTGSPGSVPALGPNHCCADHQRRAEQGEHHPYRDQPGHRCSGVGQRRPGRGRNDLRPARVARGAQFAGSGVAGRASPSSCCRS